MPIGAVNYRGRIGKWQTQKNREAKKAANARAAAMRKQMTPFASAKGVRARVKPPPVPNRPVPPPVAPGTAGIGMPTPATPPPAPRVPPGPPPRTVIPKGLENITGLVPSPTPPLPINLSNKPIMPPLGAPARVVAPNIPTPLSKEKILLKVGDHVFCKLYQIPIKGQISELVEKTNAPSTKYAKKQVYVTINEGTKSDSQPASSCSLMVPGALPGEFLKVGDAVFHSRLDSASSPPSIIQKLMRKDDGTFEATVKREDFEEDFLSTLLTKDINEFYSKLNKNARAAMVRDVKVDNFSQKIVDTAIGAKGEVLKRGDEVFLCQDKRNQSYPYIIGKIFEVEVFDSTYTFVEAVNTNFDKSLTTLSEQFSKDSSCYSSAPRNAEADRRKAELEAWVAKLPKVPTGPIEPNARKQQLEAWLATFPKVPTGPIGTPKPAVAPASPVPTTPPAATAANIVSAPGAKPGEILAISDTVYFMNYTDHTPYEVVEFTKDIETYTNTNGTRKKREKGIIVKAKNQKTPSASLLNAASKAFTKDLVWLKANPPKINALSAAQPVTPSSPTSGKTFSNPFRGMFTRKNPMNKNTVGPANTSLFEGINPIYNNSKTPPGRTPLTETNVGKRISPFGQYFTKAAPGAKSPTSTATAAPPALTTASVSATNVPASVNYPSETTLRSRLVLDPVPVMFNVGKGTFQVTIKRPTGIKGSLELCASSLKGLRHLVASDKEELTHSTVGSLFRTVVPKGGRRSLKHRSRGNRHGKRRSTRKH